MTASAIESFVNEPAIAIVGVSRSGDGFGNSAMKVLRGKGYRVYPIHPSASQASGMPCYRTFADLPERVDAALVVVPPAQAIGVVRAAAAAGIRKVWLQQGAESPEVLQACEELGLETVSRECILMFTQPSGFHRVHRWIHDVFTPHAPAA